MEMVFFFLLTIWKTLLKLKLGTELWNLPVQFKSIFNWTWIPQFKQYSDMQQYLCICKHIHTKKQTSAIQNNGNSKMPLKPLISPKSRAHHLSPPLAYTLMKRLWMPAGTPWFTSEDLNSGLSDVFANILICWLWPAGEHKIETWIWGDR